MALRTAQEQLARDKGPWVVTFEAEFSGEYRATDEFCSGSTTEWFRGDKSDCLRIAKAFGGFGEDDRRRNKSQWRVVLGTASDWDDFLADLEN